MPVFVVSSTLLTSAVSTTPSDVYNFFGDVHFILICLVILLVVSFISLLLKLFSFRPR